MYGYQRGPQFGGIGGRLPGAGGPMDDLRFPEVGSPGGPPLPEGF